MKRIVLIGPQGSGKGTQGALLTAVFGIPSISPGALYRHHVKEQTELGKLAQEIMAKGDLVPDEVTKRVIAERVAESDAQSGFILDGYPRNAQQMADLKDITAIDHVIVITLDDEEAVRRISGRRQCKNNHIYHVEFNPPAQEGVCDVDGEELTQRKDDTEDAVKKRLGIYHQETEPLIAAYREQGVVHEVNGAQSVDDVQKDIVKILQ